MHIEVSSGTRVLASSLVGLGSADPEQVKDSAPGTQASEGSLKAAQRGSERHLPGLRPGEVLESALGRPHSSG